MPGGVVKTVTMKVLADAGDAQSKLDAIDAKAQEISKLDPRIRVIADDADAKAKMTEIRAEADRLGRDTTVIKVRVDDAGVKSRLAELKKAADDAGGGGGILGKLFGGGGGGPSLSGLVTPMSGAGGIMGALTNPAVIAAVIPVAGALLTEVVGIGSGLAAAGIGLASFGAVAKANFTTASTAAQAVQTAQDQYTASVAAANSMYQQQMAVATTTAQRKAAESTHAHALMAAEAQQVKATTLAYAELSGPQVTLSKSIGQAQNAWQSFVQSNTDGVSTILNKGIGLLPRVFQNMQPFMKPVENAISGILGKLDKATTPVENVKKIGDGLHHIQRDLLTTGGSTSGSGFQSFMDKIQKISPAAVTAIGDGVGKVAGAIGHLLTVLSAKDVSTAIGIVFNTIAGTITGVANTVHFLMFAWDDASRAVKTAAHGFAQSFDQDMGRVKGAIHTTASTFDEIRHGAAAAVGSVISTIGGVPGKIKSVFASAGNWLLDAGKQVVMGLVHGIESMVGAAVSAAAGVGDSILHGIKAALSIFSPSKKAHVIGQQTIQGLLLGLQGGQTELSTVSAILADSIVKPFTSATITTTIDKLGSMLPARLTGWLKFDNAKLQALANQRAILEKEIALSEQVAQQAITSASVMNAVGASQNGPVTPADTSQILAGMQAQAEQQKAFAQQIAQLQKAGLNATSISQIVQAGAASGLPIAQGITAGGKSAITQINAYESQIHASAAKLGDVAGPAMYQAGVDAGKGLAAGLKSQLATVSAAIAQLAAEIIARLKKDLKIKSPSEVTRAYGQFTGQGFEHGILDWLPAVSTAGGRMAAAVTSGLTGAYGGGGGYGRGGDVHIHIDGVVTDPNGVARQVVQVLKEYKRHGGGAALGIA